jgi:hypothetical protein
MLAASQKNITFEWNDPPVDGQRFEALVCNVAAHDRRLLQFDKILAAKERRLLHVEQLVEKHLVQLQALFPKPVQSPIVLTIDGEDDSEAKSSKVQNVEAVNEAIQPKPSMVQDVEVVQPFKKHSGKRKEKVADSSDGSEQEFNDKFSSSGDDSPIPRKAAKKPTTKERK